MIGEAVFQTALAVLPQVLSFEQPAESVLAAFFRKNRKLGTQERLQVGNLVFSLLRHRISIGFFLANKTTSFANELVCAAAVLFHRDKKTVLADETLDYPAFFSDKDINLAQAYLASFQQLRTYTAENLPEEVLSARTELPQWLLERLNFLDKTELLALSDALLGSGSLDLRVNLVKAKRDKVLTHLQTMGFAAEQTPYSPWGIRLSQKISLSKNPLFIDGCIEVQDEGSQLLALISGTRRNELVVDFCAGAGGKTLALGAMMGNTGRIYALDIDADRLRNIRPRLERSGLSNVTTQQIAHAKDNRLQKLTGKADRVLIDAPCSGTGTLRRHPDLKYRQNIQTLEQLRQTQQHLLASASKLLRNGGTLVYATCSLLPEENEQQVMFFLNEHPDFELVQMHSVMEKCKINLEMNRYLRLNPAEHNTDGFFSAVMIKHS